jgi:hypothetical protein
VPVTEKGALGPVTEKGALGPVTEKGALHLLHGDLHPIARPEPVPLGKIDVEPQGIRIRRSMLLGHETVSLLIDAGDKADLSRDLDCGHGEETRGGGVKLLGW